jgi:hypothetical protein
VNQRGLLLEAGDFTSLADQLIVQIQGSSHMHQYR